MKYSIFALVLLGQASAPTGQNGTQPYEPVVPPASVGVYGGYGGNRGGYGGGAGSTVAGSAMAGMSDVISAKGNYNLATSAAAVNMTQAQKNEIQNRQQYTNTYFQMRQENRAYREQERGPRPTEEQLARLAHQGLPQPVSPSQVNHVTGQINWLGPLQMASFAEDRSTVEELMGKKSQNGSLSYADQTAMRKVLNDMIQELKGLVRSVPPQDYIESKNFLDSLMYATAHTAVG